jgi:antirestriction protein ArdC
MELEVYGETESCLKSFLRTVYFHSPDDIIIREKKSIESSVLRRSEKLKYLRENLRQEIDLVFKCLESSSEENSRDVFDHLEGLKSVYEAKRNAFRARSPAMKVAKDEYCRAKMELLRRELETDVAFGSR